jgi:hypothetical protein
MANRQSIRTKAWREIIEEIEIKNQGLADTLAIMDDPELQNFLKKSGKDIGDRSLIPLDEA